MNAAIAYLDAVGTLRPGGHSSTVLRPSVPSWLWSGRGRRGQTA